ncbi:polyprenyl synthetase family protein [Aerosakkonema funiforme]|uniref:Polyprenyl synthetase family protein n=2 Tax=Oscillatoriophycideae TaxID=1301283 RepID=A0A926VD48_9CYAN|nr:polyprenyl synthetase family protein [Aerosakkonema funiforme]MBD2181622.1 polyprenyl synthetase family protein [Aerosakkonema funiforme FACHB-1375]
MLGIILFALYLSFFAWIVCEPKHEKISQLKKVSQAEDIKIITATPKKEAQDRSVLAVAVSVGNGNNNQFTNGQQVYPPASKSAFNTHSTKLNGGEAAKNLSTTLAASVPPSNSVSNSVELASQGSLAIASSTNITTSLPNGNSNGNSNGHSNGHSNGNSNGHSNGNSNGHSNGNLNGDSNEQTLEKHQAESVSHPAEDRLMYDKQIINQAIEESRFAVVKKIKEFVETKNQTLGSYQPLYELLTDYPFRVGKMLRPTMCISAARAVGGMGHEALTSAAALELYHNAFLIHDDIEDGSESRRGKGTLHQMIGIPRAINVGDATNVLAVGLLLENLSTIGVAKALNVLHEIEFMAQQSVEGQAMELDWVATNAAYLTDQDYFKMCVKKTCWYSFITPCRIGLIVGYPSASNKELTERLAGLTRFGMILGIAFQIQDDLLNLQGELEAYGKEIGGDIYEGKRTLMLNHVLANSGQASRQILDILALPREEKTPDQLAFIMDKMQQCGSIEHAWKVARSLANKAAEIFESLDFLQKETPLRSHEEWECPVHDRRFLKELINYVIYRNV